MPANQWQNSMQVTPPMLDKNVSAQSQSYTTANGGLPGVNMVMPPSVAGAAYSQNAPVAPASASAIGAPPNPLAELAPTMTAGSRPPSSGLPPKPVMPPFTQFENPAAYAQYLHESDAYDKLQQIVEAKHIDRAEMTAAVQELKKKYPELEGTPIMMEAEAHAAGVPLTLSPGMFTAKQVNVDAERMTDVDRRKNGIPDGAKGNWVTFTNPMTGEPDRPAQPAATTSTQIRSVPHTVAVQNARQLADTGVVYNDQSGNPIDLNKIPNNMALQSMVRGNQQFWVPVSPTQRTVTVGNEVIAVNPQLMDTIANGGGTALGQARVGTSSTPTSVTVGPDGMPRITGSTSTPNTSGARISPPPTGSVAPVSSSPLMQPSPKTAASPKQTSNAATTGLPPGITLPAGTVTPGMDTTFRKRAVPVRALMTQVFGDPENPEIRSMESFAPLADDKSATQRIGTAIRLLQSDENNLAIITNSDTSGWAAHGGSGMLIPVSVGGDVHGGKGSSSQNITAEKAAQLNANLKNAMEALKTPEERQAVVASLKAYEEASGLRSLISSGGALASIATIQKTLPIIGVNTFSAQDYKDRLRRLAEDGANGKWGIPPNYLGQNIIDRMNQVRSGGQAVSPPPTAIPTAPAVARPAGVPANAVWNPDTRRWRIP